MFAEVCPESELFFSKVGISLIGRIGRVQGNRHCYRMGMPVKSQSKVSPVCHCFILFLLLRIFFVSFQFSRRDHTPKHTHGERSQSQKSELQAALRRGAESFPSESPSLNRGNFPKSSKVQGQERKSRVPEPLQARHSPACRPGGGERQWV